MACFIPQNIAMQKKKNRKFWTWRYSFLIDRILLEFSVGLSFCYSIKTRCEDIILV